MFGVRKLSLSRVVVCVIIRSAVVIAYSTCMYWRSKNHARVAGKTACSMPADAARRVWNSLSSRAHLYCTDTLRLSVSPWLTSAAQGSGAAPRQNHCRCTLSSSAGPSTMLWRRRDWPHHLHCDVLGFLLLFSFLVIHLTFANIDNKSIVRT